MYILLIGYILFLLIYLAINGYIIFRVNKIRVKNDLTSIGIIVYAIAITAVMVISFMIIGMLNWTVGLF